MNICSNDHIEIAFEGKTCPLCCILEELQSALDALNDANQEIYTLKEKIIDLEKDIADLERE